MKTRTYYSVLFCLLFPLVIACHSKKQTNQEENSPVAGADTLVVDTLAALEAGEVYLKDQNPFGEDLDLVGQEVTAPDDFIFKPGGAEMLVCDSLLFLSSYNAPYYVFRYPELTYIKTIGKRGNGPDEFINPNLVASATPSALCYLMEGSREQLYEVTPLLEMKPYSFSLNNGNAIEFSSSKQVVNTEPDTFYYVDNAKPGKAIYSAARQGDSIVTKEVFNLTLNPKRKSPFSYIGSFGINQKRDRMVYAYKYFKVLKFMDLEGKTVKTLNFAQNSMDEGTLRMTDGLDQNVTNYMAVCTTDKYVYVTYSGRTPVAVGQDASKKNYYMYVEQYDWNGNPIHRYRVNHFSVYVTMDPDGRMLLIMTYKDDPFCFFDFPQE